MFSVAVASCTAWGSSSSCSSGYAGGYLEDMHSMQYSHMQGTCLCHLRYTQTNTHLMHMPIILARAVCNLVCTFFNDMLS
jgi:hypothetical protein